MPESPTVSKLGLALLQLRVGEFSLHEVRSLVLIGNISPLGNCKTCDLPVQGSKRSAYVF